ncbi:hypothetical protein M434DRAFT_397049 [Hypoxylon sp. CO27-5]|nr:hypothetical protein M434DRAFT_397049 [Hypoxylon sp. CO27-5]
MPPPLSVPSKAAIHALRGIALGTSCAIGVIVEDRRRRISTLKTALSNKEKLKSAKQYHGMANAAALQFDEAFFVGDELHWHQLDDRTMTCGDSHTVEAPPRRNPREHVSSNTESMTHLHSEDKPKSSSRPTSIPKDISAPSAPSKPPKIKRSTTPLALPRRTPTFPETKINVPTIDAHTSWREGEARVSRQRDMLDESVERITSLLAGKEEGKLDRALEHFFEASRSLRFAQGFNEEWVSVSAQLSRACQAEDRFVDAGKVLVTTIDAGPLEESQFYAHEPMPVIVFHLNQKDGNGCCLPSALATATAIFLTKFKEKPKIQMPDIVKIGSELFAQNIFYKRTSVIHDIYWRVISTVVNAGAFAGWVIQELYKYRDYKSVIKYFLLNFSKMTSGEMAYNRTIDCVIFSVEFMNGSRADEVHDALYRMKRPSNGFLRTRWIMRLLQAHWRRNQDFSSVKALFEQTLTLGLLDEVTHPEGVYRTMVEISVKAGEYDAARSYHETIMQKYPYMASDVALRGFIALGLAKAGNWDGVLDAFTEMQALKDGHENQYDDAFVMVLKVFVKDHPVAEIRDFVSKYTSDLGVRMHRYVVTLVANKYGECHDVPGFVSWLRYCGEAGFALDSAFCNSVLYNGRTKFGLSYNEMRELCLEMEHIGGPDLFDDVTRRIMSQAALETVKPGRGFEILGVHSWMHAVDDLAYMGRSANTRDVYEAMNQELNRGKPATALSIYKGAISSGMPSCEHCLRLAVVATLNSSQGGSTSAISLIHDAHQHGVDVSPAVSAFIKFKLDHVQANPQDILFYMRNLVSRFETLNIIVDSTVLTHMALMCVKMGHYERVISLCTLARDRGGFKTLCFSRQSTLAMLVAYAKLLDLEGMWKLNEDILMSTFATEKVVLSGLRSAKRTIQRYKRTVEKHSRLDRGAKINRMLDILKSTIDTVIRRRRDEISGGKVIAQEALEIMLDAAESMGRDKASKASRAPQKYAIDEEQLEYRDSREDSDTMQLIGSVA